jgi:hypothetical protein
MPKLPSGGSSARIKSCPKRGRTSGDSLVAGSVEVAITPAGFTDGVGP